MGVEEGSHHAIAGNWIIVIAQLLAIGQSQLRNCEQLRLQANREIPLFCVLTAGIVDFDANLVTQVTETREMCNLNSQFGNPRPLERGRCQAPVDGHT